jgi:hypothetical protein
MAFLDEHKAKFDNLRVSLETQNRDQLRRKANGGNSILFSYPPSEEEEYLEHARNVLPDSEFRFIDVATLFVEFIEKLGLEKVENRYKIYRATPHKVFSSGETGLADLIVQKISEADQEGYIPVLIRTGVLHGTGIENVNIMEHKGIMKLKNPLIIFYPAKAENGNLYFLNFKPASKYRCTVI